VTFSVVEDSQMGFKLLVAEGEVVAGYDLRRD
jgi:hypothetical protein